MDLISELSKEQLQKVLNVKNKYYDLSKDSSKQFLIFILLREFLGPSPSALSKKSRIIAGDVTVEPWKRQIICADRVSVRLSCDAYSKWHMPICAEIWLAEQKYMPIFGTVTDRHFRKNLPKHRNIYKWSNATLWIFVPSVVTVERFPKVFWFNGAAFTACKRFEL